MCVGVLYVYIRMCISINVDLVIYQYYDLGIFFMQASLCVQNHPCSLNGICNVANFIESCDCMTGFTGNICENCQNGK